MPESYYIPHFNEVKDTYSKGSHNLVIWECPNCCTRQTKTFKQALKVKQCKPCNNKTQTYPDRSGKNNPMYGIRLAGKSGPTHYAWKGDRPKCPTCKLQLKKLNSRYCRSCWQKGSRNPQWKNGLTREQREKTRNTPELKEWAKQVKIRDNFTCQICKTKGGKLHSHHLNSYAKFPEQRHNLDNGITLCKPCHLEFHLQYGKVTTKEQFINYAKNLIKNIILDL